MGAVRPGMGEEEDSVSTRRFDRDRSVLPHGVEEVVGPAPPTGGEEAG